MFQYSRYFCDLQYIICLSMSTLGQLTDIYFSKYMFLVKINFSHALLPKQVIISVLYVYIIFE